MSARSVLKLLDGLILHRAEGFDPIRFTFITGLCRRLKTPLHQDNRVLVEKAGAAIKSYKHDYDLSRKRAEKTRRKLEADSPDLAPTAQILFERSEFRQLEALSERKKKSKSAVDNLIKLRGIIDQKSDNSQGSEEVPSFDDMLEMQEVGVLQMSMQSSEPNSADLDDSGQSQHPEADRVELQSVKIFRDAIRYQKIDASIEQAINTGPENPGPHNPHMLAIKAMVQLRDLSPQYLRRISSYVETLLWLEKNANRVDDSKNLPQT